MVRAQPFPPDPKHSSVPLFSSLLFLVEIVERGLVLFIYLFNFYAARLIHAVDSGQLYVSKGLHFLTCEHRFIPICLNKSVCCSVDLEVGEQTRNLLVCQAQ